MLLPTLSSGTAVVVRSADAPTTGISPSFCTPCVLGKQLCGLPFSPRLQDCDGGGGSGGCTPCILGKKICSC